MARPVPRLTLTRGQVAWTVCRGRVPEESVLNQLRYFKQLGIPFADGAQDKGRGNRVTYTFYDLMDVAVAIEAIRRGIPARLLKDLVERRTVIRKAYRECLKKIPEVAFSDPNELNAEYQTTIFADDFYIFFQGRFSHHPGDTKILDSTQMSREAIENALDDLMNGPDVTSISLRRLLVPMIVYSAKAPYLHTGPKS